MRFNIGDIVRISKKSGYYGEDECNPKDMDGEIVETDSREIGITYPIKVQWDNGESCVFREIDLKLRRRA